MNHDELLAKINANLCGIDGCDGEHYKKDDLHGEWFALRAVVELTNNLQDTESWQDTAEYNAGYNNAMYEVIQAINKELK